MIRIFVIGTLERREVRGDDGYGFEAWTDYTFSFHYNRHGDVSIKYGRDKDVTQGRRALGTRCYRTSSCQGYAGPYQGNTFGLNI